MSYLSNKISRKFGKIANRQFPFRIQKKINKFYVKFFKIDMSEFKEPSEYQSLNKLFTRTLQKPRNIDSSKESFISPTDSIITEFGITKYSTAMQIKGKSYDIQELLTDKIDQQNLKNKLEDGHYLNFYLSPRDYHHFHLPTDAKITKVIHVPGALYPVNYTALNRKKDLFNKNERVILECITPENKLYYFVLVGALNVGQIILNFEPEFNTNVKNNKNISVKNYENLNIKKGEDIGYFAMGSTVVIISEKEFLEVEKNIFTGIKVSFGEKIATIL